MRAPFPWVACQITFIGVCSPSAAAGRAKISRQIVAAVMMVIAVATRAATVWVPASALPLGAPATIKPGMAPRMTRTNISSAIRRYWTRLRSKRKNAKPGWVSPIRTKRLMPTAESQRQQLLHRHEAVFGGLAGMAGDRSSAAATRRGSSPAAKIAAGPKKTLRHSQA